MSRFSQQSWGSTILELFGERSICMAHTNCILKYCWEMCTRKCPFCGAGAQTTESMVLFFLVQSISFAALCSETCRVRDMCVWPYLYTPASINKAVDGEKLSLHGGKFPTFLCRKWVFWIAKLKLHHNFTLILFFFFVCLYARRAGGHNLINVLNICANIMIQISVIRFFSCEQFSCMICDLSY